MSRVGKDFPELDAETALIMDAVQLYVSVLKSANITKGRPIKCEGNDTWEYGTDIYNNVKDVSKVGSNIFEYLPWSLSAYCHK